MLYLGPPTIESNGPYRFKAHADEVLILQSYTTMGTKSVFKGCLKPNDEFTFKSSRLTDRHFAITIHINGIIDQRIFICCEYGFVNQSHFHTKRNSCQLQSITGGIPCEICQPLEMMNFFSNEIPDDYTNDITHPSVQSANLNSKFIKENLLTESKSNIITKKDDNKQLSLPNTSSTKYNSNVDSNNAQTSNKQDENHNTKEGVNQQSSKNTITELKQTDSSVDAKIMNEDNKTKISSAASLRIEQLLTDYLKLLLPQIKSSTSNPKSKYTTEPITYSNPAVESNRETKASMKYTDSSSMSMSAIESKAEGFVLIWLDKTIQQNQDTTDSEQKLRAIVNSLVTFQEINDVKNFIEQIQDQQIYLIVSGELGEKLVSTNQIIDSPKLNSIYIFCRDQQKYTKLTQQSNKIRAVFIEIDPLCARLKEDTEQALKNLLPISTTSEDSKNEINQIKFLCSQLHRDFLFTIEYNNNARLELADFCSNIYKSSIQNLKYVEELRTKYHAGKAIWWYSRETFLFRMLNNAFRTQDISILYKFHFFIKDLHMQLEQMHSLYKPSLATRVFTVYRGLSMSLDDFEKTIHSEVNNLIAFDSFLSTTLDKKTAILFSLNKQKSKSESVVFCMEIDADRMDRPFADISRWSDHKEEKEVLFSTGTVFRIVNVEDKEKNDGIWMVHLSTVSEKDKNLMKETQQIQTTLLEFFERVLNAQSEAKNFHKLPDSNANVANMLYKQGVYNESLEFYQRALKALNELESPDPLTKAIYISNVAKAHMASGHEDEALVLYKQALNIRQRLCESNDPSLIHTLHTIGHIYRGKEDWNKALERYNQALELLLTTPIESGLSSDPSSIAVTYICIGNIYDRQENHQQALEVFLKALEQQHKHLPEQHPALAFLYNNIGAMYYKLQQYDRALENHLKCLNIELKALPKEHITFAKTYKNIATTYEKLRQFNEAFEFAKKYVDQLKLHSLEDNKELIEAENLLKKIQISRDNRK
ncbi:unnamed protein product [Adineta steineri]|uniref:NAD(P)(+)--arginine ADP-ribosyltransferase n=1 Tax=Adineta steineri TaxID=433720 RepID=A0A814G2C0_9BILA|nr:unnamed protein product [Adineta steineri]CAF0993758.1 unnamed protein product [Adineta steineri]